MKSPLEPLPENEHGPEPTEVAKSLKLAIATQAADAKNPLTACDCTAVRDGAVLEYAARVQNAGADVNHPQPRGVGSSAVLVGRD
jgi:hypothetical protein